MITSNKGCSKLATSLLDKNQMRNIMTKFKNGEKVYWDNRCGRYIGQDPYSTTLSYVIDLISQEVGTIATSALSNEPPMTRRELNGKTLFEFLEPTLCEIYDVSGNIDWMGGMLPKNKEVFIRLAESLNYTAESRL